MLYKSFPEVPLGKTSEQTTNVDLIRTSNLMQLFVDWKPKRPTAATLQGN